MFSYEYIRKLGYNELISLDIRELGEGVKFLNLPQIRLLLPAQVKILKINQIQVLTPEQIAALSIPQLKALEPNQIKALSQGQIQALTVFQINALRPAQIQASTVFQIHALLPAQIQALKQEQIRVLKENARQQNTRVGNLLSSLDQKMAWQEVKIRVGEKYDEKHISSIPPAKIASLRERVAFISWAAFEKLTPEQIKEFSPEQISNLPPGLMLWWTPEGIKTLTPEQFGGFRAAQLDYFNHWQTTDFNQQQIRSIRHEELSKMENLSQFYDYGPAFTPQQISCLRAKQINSLACCIRRWDMHQVAALGPEQVKGLDWFQIHNGGLTVRQIPWLQSAAVAGLQPVQIAWFSAEQLRALTPVQIQALVREEQLQALIEPRFHELWHARNPSEYFSLLQRERLFLADFVQTNIDISAWLNENIRLPEFNRFPTTNYDVAGRDNAHLSTARILAERKVAFLVNKYPDISRLELGCAYNYIQEQGDGKSIYVCAEWNSFIHYITPIERENCNGEEILALIWRWTSDHDLRGNTNHRRVNFINCIYDIMKTYPDEENTYACQEGSVNRILEIVVTDSVNEMDVSIRALKDIEIIMARKIYAICLPRNENNTEFKIMDINTRKTRLKIFIRKELGDFAPRVMTFTQNKLEQWINNFVDSLFDDWNLQFNNL